MKRVTNTSAGPGAPTKLPSPGKASSVGPRAPGLTKPSPVKNTRDYGKAPAPTPSPNPFGPVDGGF